MDCDISCFSSTFPSRFYLVTGSVLNYLSIDIVVILSPACVTFNARLESIVTSYLQVSFAGVHPFAALVYIYCLLTGQLLLPIFYLSLPLATNTVHILSRSNPFYFLSVRA